MSVSIRLCLASPHLGVVLRYLPNSLLVMIISVLIASAFIGLMLVLLVQGKWTSQDSWFVAIFASAVMAMVIGHYVNQLVFE
jgi:ABC-type sugar transport system permease subunit